MLEITKKIIEESGLASEFGHNLDVIPVADAIRIVKDATEIDYLKVFSHFTQEHNLILTNEEINDIKNLFIS